MQPPEGQPLPNQMEMCQIIMITIFNFMFSLSDKNSHIDNMAHVGGLICGFLIGFPFVVKADAPASCCLNVKNTRFFFFFLTLLYFGLCFGYLFFGDMAEY